MKKSFKNKTEKQKEKIAVFLAITGTLGLFMLYLLINSFTSPPQDENTRVNGFTEIKDVFNQSFKEAVKVRDNYSQEKEIIAQLKAEAEAEAEAELPEDQI
jgi:hypothetical protein